MSNRQTDEGEASERNSLDEEMQNPITNSNSKARQNWQAQPVSNEKQQDEKQSPELEAALHSSYME
jgi:vesicle coat complex subunit